jgi:4'-phosphopantetheinyl transferase
MSSQRLLRPVILAAPPEQRALAGRARVAAQRALALRALRMSAERSAAGIDAFEKDAHGAPLPANGWFWSVSHTREFSAGVVARASVGIDVERVAARHAALLPYVLDAHEQELLGARDWRSFVRAWTAKEAVLKRAGCGLAELGACRIVGQGADHLVLAHRGREHVALHSEHAGHVAALCTDEHAAVRWEWAAWECVA